MLIKIPLIKKMNINYIIINIVFHKYKINHYYIPISSICSLQGEKNLQKFSIFI